MASEYHEVRLAALLTLVEIFSHAKRPGLGISREACIGFYLSHTAGINKHLRRLIFFDKKGGAIGNFNIIQTMKAFETQAFTPAPKTKNGVVIAEPRHIKSDNHRRTIIGNNIFPRFFNQHKRNQPVTRLAQRCAEPNMGIIFRIIAPAFFRQIFYIFRAERIIGIIYLNHQRMFIGILRHRPPNRIIFAFTIH